MELIEFYTATSEWCTVYCAYVVLCTVLYLEVRSSSDLDLTQTIACTDVVSNSLGENTSSIARPGLY